MLPNGSWADVDYGDTTRTGAWSPHIHLDRMVNMAGAVRSTNGSQSGGVDLAAATTLAIQYWLAVDPKSANWFWNELRVPDRIADTALLLAPWVTSARLLAGMTAVMRRATGAGRTGANLDAEVNTAIKCSALHGNASGVAAGFARLWHEIRVVQPSGCLRPPPGTTGCATDGIQADRSFHQHGPELLAGLYGEGYAQDTLAAVALSQGTSFAPPAPQSELFADLLLDGMWWMTIGSPAVWDWSVKGRDLGTVPRRVGFNASLLAGLHTANRSADLAAFGRAITGLQAPADALQGHRAYWTSDYSVLHSRSPGGVAFVASVHMHSRRTVSARCVNGQGAMSEHTGDGVVYTYITGREYDGAFSSWDWRRLPGITAAVDSPMLPCNYADRLYNDSLAMNATGTASDGEAGLSAMQLLSHGAVARKAVALLPQGLVHLVAAAGCSHGGAASCGEVVTTFENNVAAGAVHVACNNTVRPVPPQSLRVPYRGCQWAWHNGTGYLFPPGGAVLITNGAEANATTALFSLAVSHTPGLGAPESWLAAVPGVPLADMVGVAAAGNSAAVAANREAVQAVWDSRRDQLLAVIWAAGTPHAVQLPPTARLALGAVQSDRPCVMLVRRGPGMGTSSVTVTASDPSNNPAGGSLTLTLTPTVSSANRALTADLAGVGRRATSSCRVTATGDLEVVLLLPAGYAAGKSVSVTCRWP